MKTVIRNLLAAMLVAASLQTHAQGLVYDQQSATGPTSPPADDFFHIQEDSPLMQSFMPTLSTIGFVQFEFWDIANNGNNGATVYVNLWTGSPNVNSATLLGSTTPVYMPNGFVNDGLGFAGITSFSFSTPVTLTASQTYYLQPVVLSGDNPWDIAVVDGAYYSNGRLYGSTGGYIQPITDLWFREGIVSVPEPSTLALVGFGFLIFIRRRCRNFSHSLIDNVTQRNFQGTGDPQQSVEVGNSHFALNVTDGLLRKACADPERRHRNAALNSFVLQNFADPRTNCLPIFL